MKKIDLVFPTDFDDANVVAILARGDSGFKRDSRQPLRSGIDTAIEIAGLVVSAAQLGVAIWSLLLQRQQQTGQPIEQASPILVRDAGGKLIPLPKDSEISVTALLEHISKS